MLVELFPENYTQPLVIPSFKRGEYGKGIYEITKTVADRLREVDENGENTLIIKNDRIFDELFDESWIRSLQFDAGLGLILILLFVLSPIQDFFQGVPKELQFAKCEVCGARTSWSRRPVSKTIEKASTAQRGLEEIKCSCQNCGNQVSYTRETPEMTSPIELILKEECEIWNKHTAKCQRSVET